MAQNLVANIETKNSVLVEYLENLKYNVESCFKIENIEENDIEEVIRTLNYNAACGYYKISSKFIQNNADKFASILKKLINDCLKRNVFPDILKMAKIIPIFKGGSATDIDSYRPIAVLNVFSKIFEKIMFNRLAEHFQINSIISKFQYGFTVNSNTTAACMELTHYITSAIDKKLFVACIFLDLSKAFDTVDRSLLIKKLKKVNIHEDTIHLFESYLLNRDQAVYIDQVYSELDCCSSGVPQGSNLGPLLFSYYLNDVSFLNLHGKIQLFADDIVIKYCSEDDATLFTKMNEDIVVLHNWFDTNRLVMNIKKSKYMLFKNRLSKLQQHVYYKTQKLERVSSYKYLGLLITDTFKWNEHVDMIKRKILPYIFSINKLKNILSRKSLETIYYSYIYAQIIYLNPIWSSCTQYKLDQLYVLQKRALKYVVGVHWQHPTELLFEGNRYKSLPYIIKYELLVAIYKIVNNYLHHNFQLRSVGSIHQYQTRRRSHFSIEHFSSDICKQNVFYKGLNEFNILPPELRKSISLINFKKQLIEYLPEIF